MYMVSAQHTLHDMDLHFCASLHGNFTDPFTYRTLQNLEKTSAQLRILLHG
jgi:hypothetical protein